MTTNREIEEVIGSVLTNVPGHRFSTEISLLIESCVVQSRTSLSPSEPPLDELERGGRHAHTQRSQTQSCTFPCLRMRPNVANLDNLKHDKEQDDRKTIKGARKQVRESASRGYKKW